MDETPEAENVRLRMEQLRTDLGRNVEHTVDNVRAMLDWRHYVVTHPWLSLTAAAAAGFLLAPRPRPTALLQSPQHAALASQLPSAGGIVTALVGVAANVAMRTAVSQLARHLENRFHKGDSCGGDPRQCKPPSS